MSEEVAASPTDQPRHAVRFAGVYRSDRYGVVDARDAALMSGILRNAFRKNFNNKGVTVGMLLNLVGRLQQDDEHWEIALERLVNWGFIVKDVSLRSDSVVVRLTQHGTDEATELIGQRQPVDGE